VLIARLVVPLHGIPESALPTASEIGATMPGPGLEPGPGGVLPGPAIVPGPAFPGNTTSSPTPGPPGDLPGRENGTTIPVNSGTNAGVPIPLIVGVVCGIVGLFIILGCITAYCRRRRAKVSTEPGMNDEQEKTDGERTKTK
jgi:hypothetical protein